MIPVKLSPQQVAKVQERARERKTLNSRTIVSGEGNVAGFAGEAMAKMVMPGAVDMTNSRDFDFMLGNLRIDVKTRATDLQPKDHWDCKIPEYSVKQQNCDVYVFAATRKDGTSGFVLGWISKADFLRIARREEADNLFAQYGKHVVNASYLIVPVSSLRDMKDLKTA